jgi:predicted enzyme related to lactoylglutathione lyase
MIQITEIAFTAYPVTDMARARHFYEGVLGLKQSALFEQEGKAWVEYDIGAGTLALSNMTSDWKPSSMGPGIALEVADFDEAVSVLRRAGAKFVYEPFDSPACQTTIVCDPDGNAVALHKRKKP